MSVDLLAKASAFDGTEPYNRQVLSGLVGIDWVQTLIARGYGWGIEVGNFDTGITGGGAGTVIDLDQPEFGVSVPSGYTLVPFDVKIVARPGLQTTDSHVTDILLAVDRTAAWAGDGTVTTETPVNLRTNTVGGCPASCFSAATGDITDPVLGAISLDRRTLLTDVQGTAATVNLMELKLDYTPRRPPFLVGPCAMYGYFGGSIAVVGFAQVNFLVIPSTLITGLS